MGGAKISKISFIRLILNFAKVAKVCKKNTFHIEKTQLAIQVFCQIFMGRSSSQGECLTSVGFKEKKARRRKEASTNCWS